MFAIALNIIIFFMPVVVLRAEEDEKSYGEAVQNSATNELLAEASESYKLIQDRIDDILLRYLNSTDLPVEDIGIKVTLMDWETYQTARSEIWNLEKSEEFHKLTEVEIKNLIDSNAIFITFSNALEERAATDTEISLLKQVQVLEGLVVITDTADSISEDAGTVTVKATGWFLGATKNTITISNQSGVTATLTFDYRAEGYGSFSLNEASDTITETLDPGSSVTISIQGKAGFSSSTGVLTLSNFELLPVAEISDVTFTFDNSLGNVTVNGSKITDGDTVTGISRDEGVAVVAKANSGVMFLGWVDENGNVISSESSDILSIAQNVTITAAFSSRTSEGWFRVGTRLYNDLNEAISTANNGNNKNVILVADGTLPKSDYTIPTGVTLLIPFDDVNTLYTTEPATENAYTPPTAYRTLTMKNGANITVEKGGALSISGKHSSKMNSYNGQPTGPQGFIAMNEGSNITVEDGGALYVWGYIVGEKRTNNNETPLGGTVTIEDGGLVYECFQVTDYRGGTATSGMTSGSNINTYHVFPMSQYYVQNIQVPMILNAGATENGYFSVNASLIGNQSAPVPFIGSEGMFRINSGYLIKDYDEKSDRLMVDIYGDIEMAPMSINIAVSALKVNIDSNKYVLPLTNNITVTLHSGYTVDITQDLAILPGAELIVDEGAVVNIGTSEASKNVYAYDVDEWGGYCGEYNDIIRPLSYAYDRFVSRTANDLEDAIVLVNGIVDCTYGYAYTTLGGANICSTGTGQVISGVPGTKTNTYQATQGGTGKASTDISYSFIQIVPAILKNADGIDPSYVETSGATTVTIYNYYAGVWRSQFDIYATSVRVGDSLELYFYIQKEDLQGITDYTAKLVRTKEGQEESEAEVIPFTATSTTSGWEEYGEYYRFYYDDIAAKEMTDEIKVTIYYDDGSNRAASTLCEESIQSYALRTLGRTTDSDTNLRTVLVDMLNYGEACQNYFDGYNSDDLATTGLTDTQSDYGSQNKAEYSMEDIKGSYSASFSAKSNLMFTFYFTQPTSGTATVTYKDHYGNTQTPQVSISGPISVTDEDTRETITYYYVDVPGLAVADGRQILTCTITDGSEETTFKGSVQSFIAQRTERYDAKVEAGTATEKEALEMAAYEMLLKFVDSARIYFGTSSNPYE